MFHLNSLLVLFSLCVFFGPSSLQIHVNEFAVHIRGPPELADFVANKYGFVNKGQVGSLEGYYRFEHSRIQKRSVGRSDYYLSLLQNDTMVHWCEQQVLKKRVKRSAVGTDSQFFTDPLYPEQWFLHSENGDYDMNVQPAWEKGYTGKGIVVSILDDGVQGNHPDLALNYDEDASWDINDNDNDPSPKDDDDNRHGTRCAGEVAAVANNEFCGVGVAFNSQIGGVRMLDGRVTDTIEATALSFKPDYIDIYSASWGPEDDGKTVDGPGPLAKIAFEDGVKKGRSGLGSIFVWASGNGGKLSDNCNCDGYTNSIYTISISSATESGYKPWYLEECSSTIATTYSSGTTSEDRNIVTVDVNYAYMDEVTRGKAPNSSSLCTLKHTGTSASAPIAAGLCALALEANPKLTWRDMQYIIVLTSRYLPLSKEDGWITNGANRKVSTKFGYGLMDGSAMVDLAAKWKTLIPQHVCSTTPDNTIRVIPRHKGELVEATIYTDGCRGTKNVVRFIEHVQVTVSLTFHPRGHLHIMLVSPKSTSSSLLFPRPHDTVLDQNSFNDWPFMSVHFWGEEVDGPWKLVIHNAGKNSAEFSGSLTNWSITFYGTEDLPECVKNKNCVRNDSEKQNFSNHYFPTRGVTSSSEKFVVKCKSKKEFLFNDEKDQPYCVSKCPQGFYGNIKNYFCQKCDESCYVCYGPSYNNCLVCPPTYFLLNSTCIKYCPEGYFPDTVRNIDSDLSEMMPETVNFYQCVPCAYACLACNGNLYECTICKNGFYLYKNHCLPNCPPGTYPAENKCMSCHSDCQLCYGPLSKNCLACFPGHYLMDRSCLSACPVNHFDNDYNRCVRCHRSCATCTSQDSCIDCAENYRNTFSSQVLCELMDCKTFKHKSFSDNCSSCYDSKCEICSSPKFCDKCRGYWFNGECNDRCPVSTYENYGECHKCLGKCYSCDGDPYLCTECLKGYFLDQRYSICLASCPAGFYGSEQKLCKRCHSSCNTCFGPSSFQCMSCQPGTFLVDNICTLACTTGYFLDKSYVKDLYPRELIIVSDEQSKYQLCAPCHPTCQFCSEYGPFSCTSCYPESMLIDSSCVPCPDGFFKNISKKVCERCHDNCGTCFGPSLKQCSSCLAPLRLHKNKHMCFPCCLHELKDDCCTCSEDLDFCVVLDDSNMTFTTKPPETISKEIVVVAVGFSAATVIVFIILFLILQYRSSGSWSHGFRGKKYIPIPRELSARFSTDQEKVSLTQADADEEDDLYLKA